MRQSPPQRVEPQGELFEVTVENPGQVELLNAELPKLLVRLRGELNNDFVELRFAVSEKTKLPTAWTDREVLAHMVEDHPLTAKFIHDLNLSL